MCKTTHGRILATLCLVSITGCVLSGCGSKNADSAAPAGSTPSGNNQAAIDHGKAIAAAYAQRHQSGGVNPAPSHP